MPIAVRYTQHASSRSGWLWPVDAKGEPLKATSYMAVGFYVAKYVNEKSDMDLAAKGLGAKEWNNSLKSIFFFQAEDGIRDGTVTGVQTCALPIYRRSTRARVVAVFAAIAGSLTGLASTMTWAPTACCAASRTWVSVASRPPFSTRSEIGRASCRERVYISVVADTLQKKEKLRSL